MAGLHTLIWRTFNFVRMISQAFHCDELKGTQEVKIMGHNN